MEKEKEKENQLWFIWLNHVDRMFGRKYFLVHIRGSEEDVLEVIRINQDNGKWREDDEMKIKYERIYPKTLQEIKDEEEKEIARKKQQEITRLEAQLAKLKE